MFNILVKVKLLKLFLLDEREFCRGLRLWEGSGGPQAMPTGGMNSREGIYGVSTVFHFNSCSMNE